MSEKCQAPKISGIYKIINKINGKYYIGRSDNILGTSGRWKEHINRLNNDNHENTYLQRAWNKYGKENFEFVIVKEIYETEKLKELEQIYLDEIKSDRRNLCYNLSFSSAGGGNDGHKHTEECKKRISEKLKGRTSPMKGRKRVEWMTKYLVDNFLTGDKNARWKTVDESTKNLLFELYKSRGSTVARNKAKEYGIGSCVFTKRLLKEFRNKLNNDERHTLQHYKFMNDDDKNELFSIWKAEGYDGICKFALKKNFNHSFIARTLKELKDQGYKRHRGHLYLNGERIS